MFAGAFDAITGRPHLGGLLLVFGPMPVVVPQPVRFLVDTGSDRSLIGPVDSANLGIDVGRLPRTFPVIGIGGSVRPHFTHSAIILGDSGDGPRYGFVLPELEFVTFELASEHVPSLLGRDVLDQLRMVYDPSGDGLRFDVRSYDFEFQDPARGATPR